MLTVPVNEYARLIVYPVVPLAKVGERVPPTAVKVLNVASVEAAALAIFTVYVLVELSSALTVINMLPVLPAVGSDKL